MAGELFAGRNLWGVSKANTLEDGMLKLIFQNVDFTTLGDAGGLRGSATPGLIYITLHTADPGEAGDQTTSEATYTGYARKSIARNNTEWSVSAGVAQNLNSQNFAACSAGSNTVTHFGIGTDPTGAGKLLYSGALTASRVISAGITPSIAVSGIQVTED